MAQMVSDMLYLAQTDNAAVEGRATKIDIAAEVQALFDYYEGWAEERGVSLRLQGSCEIAGDRLMLQRALSNLLSNAIRHTPDGGTVTVKLDKTQDDSVHIAVQNPGQGIPPEHLARVFDRFYRVDPSRQRRGEGAGLGLAIVKSIVEAHGGAIDVASIDDMTTFEIALPRPPSGQSPCSPDTAVAAPTPGGRDSDARGGASAARSSESVPGPG